MWSTAAVWLSTTATVVLSHPLAIGQSTPLPSNTVRVEIFDLAGVPVPIRQQAEAEVERLFHHVRIRTDRGGARESDTADADCVRSVRIYIVREGTFRGASHDSSILGATLSGASRSRAGFVSYDRVLGLSRATLIAPGALLGYIVAHELGHLILPHVRHARRGLMREPWGREELLELSQGNLRFVPEYGGAMRAQLAEFTADCGIR